MTTSGIHAGMLYNVGNYGSLYFIDDRGAKSPLDNPKLLEAVKNTNQLVFNFIRSNENEAPQYSSTLAHEIEANLTLKEIEGFNAILEMLLKQPSLELKGGAYAAYLLRLVFLNGFFPSRQVSEIQKAYGKECVSLLSAKGVVKFVDKLTAKLSQNPLFYPLIKIMVKHPAIFTEGAVRDDLFGQFWDRGEIMDPNAFDTQKLIPLIKEIEESFSIETLKNGGKEGAWIPKKIESKLLKLAQEADAFLKENPGTLMVLPSYMDLPLKMCEVKLVSPIKESIKPRGFLWEIQKSNQVMGYFLGSMHRVPKKTLEQFNSETLSAFEACSILAVEVDPTDLTNKKKAMEYYISKLDVEKKLELQGSVERFLEKDSPNNLVDGLLMISAMIEEKSGLGIDLAFIEKAKKREIKIVNLESIYEHTDAELEFHPSSFIFENLDKMIDMQKQEVRKMFDELIAPGLVQKLEIMFNKESEAERQTLNLRNMQMANKTMKLILKGEKPFVIAGCMHFAGPFGMNKLMEGAGYKVTQIIAEELEPV